LKNTNSSKLVIHTLSYINQEFGKTIVMVTHDPQMASYCNRLILLNDEVTLEALKSSGEQEALYESWEEKILIKQAGIAEGEQIGRSKEKTEFVKKLSNKFSIEQIAEILEIDISEVEKIIKEIAK
jgi:ABC-type cobalamin/Fe3+-siderophores transport system ATPase subunit